MGFPRFILLGLGEGGAILEAVALAAYEARYIIGVAGGLGSGGARSLEESEACLLGQVFFEP